MRFGLIADSHDHIGHIRLAAGLFREYGTELVVHAGDMVSPAALLPLEGLPLAGVLGNNDGEVAGLRSIFARFGGQLEREVLVREIEGGRLAAYHGTSPVIREALVACGLYRFVVTGHTHRPLSRKHGPTWHLNPGSAHGFGGEATVMVVDTADSEPAELIRLVPPNRPAGR
ncbi:MAG: YfcE family phosphodiesterase [Magnetococcales bacterium]|nr:YfcE family phosphodiesterase [Magnetococcales bacterium]MBF0156527.1 YfcE family phosphodiesterase [Magnetococcales bacterium]